MPGARGAHRHAAQDDALAVDVVGAADGLDRLENIGLSGPAIAVFDAAQWVQFDETLLGSVCGLGIAFIKSTQKAHLAHADRPAAAMKHNVQPKRLTAVASWHDDTIGLNRPVYGGDETPANAALLLRPGL